MSKILFVCLGNICRSPAAEAIMRAYLAEAGLGDAVQCDSAGTSAGHIGEPANSRMRAAAKARGYEIEHHARQVTDFDLVEFDYILAMDQSNFCDLKDMAHDTEQSKKIYTMCSFCSRHSLSDVPDPYYGGSKGFDLVLDILEDACHGLLEKVRAELNNDT